MPLYRKLKSELEKNKTMLDAVDAIKSQLEKSDIPLGIHHKLNNIPKYYIKKYNVQGLYHFEMPDSHRLFYTVRRSKDGKEALLLELLNHDEYNKRFDYYKKKSH